MGEAAGKSYFSCSFKEGSHTIWNMGIGSKSDYAASQLMEPFKDLF